MSMQEAWNLVPDAKRHADSTTTFIIFSEDAVNEPCYFRSFNIPGKVKVNVVEGQLSSFNNILNTLQYCEKEGLLEIKNNEYTIKQGTTNHIWSVFDRDVEHEDPNQVSPKKNMQFSLSIQTAFKAGLKVAWSNDVFELWILLHFVDVTPGDFLHRNKIYEELTAFLKSLPNQSPEMTAITNKNDFNYKVFLKRKIHFLQIILPLLEPRRAKAIERAILLEKHFTSENKHHDCNPCTKVHHLVQSILDFSK